MEEYDLLILGAGPAGLTAAVYAARYHLNFIVIGKNIGGKPNIAGELENWPGFIGSGQELARNFKQHAEKLGTKFIEGEIEDVKKSGKEFIVSLKDKEVKGKTLIICLGTENKKLGIPGEREFTGKGVSYCSTCDANFFKGKDVAIVGGGDSAAKSALQLSEVANNVYIVYRGEKLKCQEELAKRIENKKIKTYFNSSPIKILGDKKVNALEILQKTKEITLDVDGIFIEIGATPVSEIFSSLKLKMEDDYIIVDKEMKTNVKGIFAAGDNTNNKFKQIVTASAEGAMAAKSVYDFLRF